MESGVWRFWQEPFPKFQEPCLKLLTHLGTTEEHFLSPQLGKSSYECFQAKYLAGEAGGTCQLWATLPILPGLSGATHLGRDELRSEVMQYRLAYVCASASRDLSGSQAATGGPVCQGSADQQEGVQARE